MSWLERLLPKRNTPVDSRKKSVPEGLVVEVSSVHFSTLSGGAGTQSWKSAPNVDSICVSARVSD